VARLFTNGVIDTSFMDQAYNQFAGLMNPFSFDPPNFVNKIALDNSGGVMIGGSFTNLGGNPYSAPYTRQQVATRYHIARLIVGYTPGPGNIEFSFPEYTVNENSG